MARLSVAVAAIAAAFVAAACMRNETAPTVQPAARPVALVTMRRIDRRVCRASALLRPICPRRVPAAIYPHRGTYLAPHGGPGERYDRFELLGLPRSGRPQHLVLFASRYGLDRVFAQAPRVRLGRPTWAGIQGELIVDASRPAAGDHLVLRWSSRGVSYAVALAAWEPMRQAIATLRAIVATR